MSRHAWSGALLRESASSLRSWAFPASAGFLLVVASICLRILAGQHSPSAELFVAVQLGAGAVYLLAVYLATAGVVRIPVWYVLAIGLICRIALLPSRPLFDDDIHRYLWDGSVLAHGVNPYTYPPSAPELAYLRDGNWAHVGYPEIRTIYPPAAQALFAVSHLIGLGSLLGLKSVFFLFDAGNMLLIMGLLGLLRRPKCWVIAYAWSPLAIKEFSNSGHLEPVMLFSLLLALCGWLGNKRHNRMASVSFALTVLVKMFPIILLPVAYRLGRWRALALIGAVVLAAHLPFTGAGRLIFSGTGIYAQHWEFNSSLFVLLKSGMQLIHPGLSAMLARVIVASSIVLYAVYSGKKLDPTDRLAVVTTVRNMLAVSLLLMPTVDPWYVTWLLPFLCLAPNSGLLIFAVTCNLSYRYYISGTFPVWIPVVEYAPVYLILLIGYKHVRRASVEQESNCVRLTAIG